MSTVDDVALHETARERYITYALSVITSRALPDVRDGLKPVQRRILYTMFHELSLHPGGRYRKCAAVVGDVMGKYHPHGDQSIYDALVRMAQDFSLRDTLVDPQGNFGSLDGDPPAAMRYTECRLRPLAEELLQEITRGTVDYRPTYDGQRNEPIVLPAQFPQLLVNGSEGIAVGLSTRIPPHHLGEVVDACVMMIEADHEITVDTLLDVVQGPDFPTGGKILNEREDLVEIYETGKGSIRLRGEWELEKEGRSRRVIITSVPYGVNKAKLIERIGEDVARKKLPLVVDADALNLLAANPLRRDNWVLTPHPGEAGRLLGKATAEVQADRLESLQQLQQLYGGTALLKGAGTLVSSDEGLPWLVRAGNPGMGSAGMGDVLTGIVAAMLAQSRSASRSDLVAAAAWVHATAGDRAALGGERGLLAGDVLAEVRACLN